MPSILHRLWLAVEPDAVFKALTTTAGLAGWWTTDVVLEGDAGSRGGIADFGFGDRAVVLRMLVDEVRPPSRLVWRCLGGNPEWQDTLVEFDLEADDGGALLGFAHRGWRRDDGALAACSYDWGRYLTSLKAFVETGTGQPHPRYRSLGKPGGEARSR